MLAAGVEAMFGVAVALYYYMFRKYGLRFPEPAPDIIMLNINDTKRGRQTFPKTWKVAIGLTLILTSTTSLPALFDFHPFHLSILAREALVPILLLGIALAEIYYRISKRYRVDFAPECSK